MEKPIAFQFAKSTSKPRLLKSVAAHDSGVADEASHPDYVSLVEKHSIQSCKKRSSASTEPLVIPLKRRAHTRPPASKQVDTSCDSAQPIDSLETAAIEELVRKAEKGDGGQSDEEKQDIPLISTEGATIGVASTIEDYTNVPVEKFGRALLRGMGVTDLQDPDPSTSSSQLPVAQEIRVRPKGLGLGASVTIPDQKDSVSGESQGDLVMCVGAYVRILSGRWSHRYGQVEAVDSDGGRLSVRLALDPHPSSPSAVSVPAMTAQLVSRATYKKNARVLNQAKFEQHQQQQQLQAARQESALKQQQSPASRDVSSRDPPASTRDERLLPNRRDNKGTWVRAQLHVRCVDRHFRGGKYFRVKMTVVDVVSLALCQCQTSDGRLLDDVPVRALETIVPRHAGAVVMIVSGTPRLARLVSRDSQRSEVTVQTLDEQEVVRVRFDDVCDFVGAVDEL